MSNKIMASISTVLLLLIINPAPLDAVGSYLSALERSKPEQSHQRSVSSRGQNNGRHSRGDNGCRSTYDFDYIMLNLQWGPGFCATSPRECTRTESHMFTIHGLWPQYKNAAPIAFCCFDNTFNFEEIKPLVPSLNKFWFSYFNSDSRGFWSHEWLKHGTCLRDVEPLQGERKFFEKTLDLVRRLPVLETLRKSSIYPTKDQKYASSDILDSLSQLTDGKRVKVDCDLEHHQPTPVLKGVNFCFDRNLNFTDCPPSKRLCSGNLFFLN